MIYPAQLHIREVSPRDGLQAEAVVLPTSAKVRLVELLADAGLPQINVASFVSPKAVPQMADGADVLAAITRRPSVVYDASVPNLRGVTAAVAAKADKVSVFVSVSDAASLRNVRRSAAEAMADAEAVCAYAREHGVGVIGTIANAFGSPYDGTIEAAKVIKLARRFAAAGVVDIALGDTTGEATPRQVSELVAALTEADPGLRVSLHLHDTRGLALANALAALQEGVSTLDAALGGIGGSPFSANAAGNLATEDLVHMCHECGIETGVDLDALIEVYRYLEGLLGHPLPGRVGKFGPSKRVTVVA